MDCEDLEQKVEELEKEIEKKIGFFELICFIAGVLIVVAVCKLFWP